VDAVLEIVRGRAAWLAERGHDQWSQGWNVRRKLLNRIARQQTWVLEDGATLVGTGTVRCSGKSTFWTPDELAEPAIYGWKLATSVDRCGDGLGELLVGWLQDRAAVLQQRYARWDVWKTNEGLQSYYKRLGAELVRTIELTGHESGALFQLPALRRPDVTARVVTDERRR
jgi:ribosomal protein S18 acetylase RimI-like enzyme